MRSGLALLLSFLAALAEAAPYAYVPDSNNNVSVVDLGTRLVVATVPVGSAPFGIAVNPAGTAVYVANRSSNTVSVIDALTNAVVGTLPTSVRPIGVAVHPDNSRLYVGHNDGVENRIFVYDTSTLQRIGSYTPNFRFAWGLTLDPAGTKAYVSFQNSTEIDVIDLSSGGHQAILSGGNAPGKEGLAINPAGTRLYITEAVNEPLIVADTATNMVVARVTPSPYSPGRQVAVNPSGTRAYVAMDTGVAVVNTATNAFITTVAVGQPSGVAVDPSGNFVYVIDKSTNRLQVIDAGTNAIVTGIPVGPSPAAFGDFVGPATITPAPAPTGTNWALASNGGVAWASSEYSDGFPASGAIDGDRAGRRWASGTAWNDGTPMQFPDALQVTFNGMKTIDRVVLYTAQDDALNPVEPTDTMTFTQHGIQDFTVEGWTGTSWVLLGRVTGNNLVKRTLTFAPVTIDRIYVNVTRTSDGYTYIAELEAWQSPTNVALAANGAFAFASSEYSPAFPASAVIDGDRAGHNWGAGSGWNDGTGNAWPDWLQVVFGRMRTIDRVVVYTLQDNATNPAEPTDSMQFSLYGIQDFSLEAWTGTRWIPLGTVTNNNLVKRTVTFPPVTVDRVFINVTRSLGGYSHITELEVFGN